MQAVRRRRTRFLLPALFAVIAVIALGFGLYRSWYVDRYPYGRTHACDKLLYLMLLQYAEANNGAFPAGGPTPEGTLSVLYQLDPNIAYLLAGKTASVDDAEQLLASGKLLDPKTCSWHYVEGLRKTDNPKLALFWDKVGLGHHGERRSEDGHTVWFIGGEHRWVSAEEWPSFISEQEKLLPKRPGLTPAIFRQSPGH
jgi:hypothetical protein